MWRGSAHGVKRADRATLYRRRSARLHERSGSMSVLPFSDVSESRPGLTRFGLF
jgi:hypothetical protein